MQLADAVQMDFWKRVVCQQVDEGWNQAWMSAVSAQRLWPLLNVCAVPNEESKILLKLYILSLNYYSELLLVFHVHVGWEFWISPFPQWWKVTMNPRVITLTVNIGAAVNHLCTVYPLFKLASSGFRGCVLSLFGFQQHEAALEPNWVSAANCQRLRLKSKIRSQRLGIKAFYMCHSLQSCLCWRYGYTGFTDVLEISAKLSFMGVSI